ncbi:hypothetical protein H6F53_13325 [Trichocoleus sp. FACHB-832]|uniref:hypothetical protein n=1 Tax=Trichocoleus sp. FACHB-832 TaxID=2692875 RepID=UPI001689E474|nr:hypothetical protein [Trichocoleus sp. FACHB-832]MBD1906458.1 hypothetical protein [Trichocoleus sp. FACHB-832]
MLDSCDAGTIEDLSVQIDEWSADQSLDFAGAMILPTQSAGKDKQKPGANGTYFYAGWQGRIRNLGFVF